MNTKTCLGSLLTLSILLLSAPPLHAAGMLVADDGGVLQIQEHHVSVTMNNGIAVTQVTQVFANTEGHVVEGIYSFPVPANASVAGFSMWINGREMIGEVIEKQAAREIYNTYKAAKRDPGLLEQSDYRTFNLRIFPIGPFAQQKVQVTYYQELDSDGQWTTYVYPLASNSQGAVNSRVSKSFDMIFDAKAADAILEMHSPSHARAMTIKRYSDVYCRATIAADAGLLDRDVVLTWRTPSAPTDARVVAFREGGSDGYFCLTLTAGEQTISDNAGADYVFLLDISASMRDDDKIGQSRGTLASLLEMLGPADQFDVLTFNTQPQKALGTLSPADDASRRKAAQFLSSQRPHGGTDFNTALAAAYQYARPGLVLNIVLISDGLSEQSSLPALTRVIARRPSQSRILCVGVGNDVDRALLQRMADTTGGLAAFLSAEDDFHRQAAGLRRKLRQPAITDAAVKIDGAATRDLEPIRLGNLFNGVPARIYGRYSNPGAATVTLNGRLAGKDFTRTFAVDLPADANANPEIQRMWAQRRMQRLLNSPTGAAADIDQIVALGQQYSIAGEYTSFVVLENDAEYSRWKIAQKNAVRLTQDRDAQARLASQLEYLRRKAPQGLGETIPVVASTAGTAPGVGPAPQPTLSSAAAQPMPAARFGGALGPVESAIAVILGICAMGLALPKKGGAQNIPVEVKPAAPPRRRSPKG